MEMKEVKEVVDAIGKDFEEFKKANDERLQQIEEKGHADPILEEKVNKAAESLNELEAMKERLEKVETAASRKARFSDGEGDLEAKATSFLMTAASLRGDKNPDTSDAVTKFNDYNKAFNRLLRKGDRLLSNDEIKALSVGEDPDGGYVVDPDTSGRIVQKIYDTSPVRQVAAVQTISTDALEGLYDLDEAASGWVGEKASRPETDTPQLGQWRIPVHDQYAFPFATQKLLDDAMIDMESWLADKVADKLAREENEAFVTGDGVSKPRGFLSYPDGTTLPGTIERVLTGASGAFPASDQGDPLISLMYSVKSAYRANGRWAMNRSTMAEVRKLKDGDGRYLWVPGIAAGQPAELLGYPVVEFDDMPDLAADSLSIAFADWTEAYQVVDRQGVRVLRDPYTNKPFVGFYTTKRTGGDVVNFEAIKLLQFGTS